VNFSSNLRLILVLYFIKGRLAIEVRWDALDLLVPLVLPAVLDQRVIWASLELPDPSDSLVCIITIYSTNRNSCP